MGQGGSVWVHFEGSRRWTVDLEVDNRRYKEYIEDMSLRMGSRFWEGLEKDKVQKRSNTYGFGIWMSGTNSYVHGMPSLFWVMCGTN